ncbi:hypothetical protein JTB14_034883 [Gonioctena quinquepunctata]|nr:hypothetical protein JTB14_034883 [Gonioctena quinquepunctata]
MAANGTVVLESSLKNKNCKKCKRTLINGVKCINCESYYHASCARNCSFIKSISEDSITCCESSVKTVSNLESDNGQAFFDAIGQLSPEKKVDISIFTYVVKQKDLIIDELRQKIKMLNDKIDQLKNIEKVSTTNTAESKKVLEKVSYAKKTLQTSAPINEPATSRGVAGCAKIPEVTEKQLSCVLLETETRRKCNDYINLANHNEEAADNGEWKQVVKK